MTTDHTPSRACYLHGCRLPECRRENYRYMSRLRLDLARGNRRRVEATQTIAHLEQLIALGWTQAQIARATSLGNRTIGILLTQGRETVSKTTALTVLSLPLNPPHEKPRNVDATGTRRRVQALVAIGWPIVQLAPKFGMHATALGHIANGDLPSVRATTAANIAHHYRTLSQIPGPSNRARIIGRRDGWHGPAAWDGAAIDDPDAQPEIEQPDELGLKRNDLAALRREEIQHLAWSGCSNEEILTRLNNEVSISTVRQIVQEWRTGQTRDRKQETAAKAGLERAA